MNSVCALPAVPLSCCLAVFFLSLLIYVVYLLACCWPSWSCSLSFCCSAFLPCLLPVFCSFLPPSCFILICPLCSDCYAVPVSLLALLTFTLHLPVSCYPWPTASCCIWMLSWHADSSYLALSCCTLLFPLTCCVLLHSAVLFDQLPFLTFCCSLLFYVAAPFICCCVEDKLGGCRWRSQWVNEGESREWRGDGGKEGVSDKYIPKIECIFLLD